MRIEKVITGGQTGAGRVVWRAAKACDIPTVRFSLGQGVTP
jgi:hypothetical protein